MEKQQPTHPVPAYSLLLSGTGRLPDRRFIPWQIGRRREEHKATALEVLNVGNWELIFSQPRDIGLLPVIKRALFILQEKHMLKIYKCTKTKDEKTECDSYIPINVEFGK